MKKNKAEDGGKSDGGRLAMECAVLNKVSFELRRELQDLKEA